MQISNAVYRYILENEYEHPKQRFTENSIARILSVSPNSVSIVIRKLSDIGAVAVYNRYFEILEINKVITYWAATRKLNKDIIYSTYINQDVRSLEKNMPGEIAYTAYTGYVNLFGNDAADYGEVYTYATENAVLDIESRFKKKFFSPRSKYANLIVLKPDKVLDKMIKSNLLYKSTVPATQLYADLWNIKEWNSYEFIKKLKKRMDDKYAKNLLQLSRNIQK